jgi:GH24 family phage-related lysozyme (muramidase)
MRLSASGAADIRLHEGFVDHWYLDATGTPTIGTGFTWGSAAFRSWWAKNRAGQAFAKGAAMTRAESDTVLMLVSDEEYGAKVNKFLGKDVPQNVFDADVSVVFNCGTGALAWGWGQKMKAGDYPGSAALLRNTAVTSKGVRLAGLVARRKDEAILLSTGKYASGGQASMPSVYDEAMRDGMLVRSERGASVMDLQTRLIAAGFAPGKPDGIFGYGTEAAVLSFQRDRKITADGKAGPKTLALLKAA